MTLSPEELAVVIQNDARAAQYLTQSGGCIITTHAMPVSVLDLAMPGVAKIRVYSGNDAVELWTTFDNLQDQR